MFFYAGHAFSSAGHESLLLPDGARMRDTDLQAWFHDLRVGSTWLIFATCHAAGFDELSGPNRILTAAAGADQVSYENLDFGHSYLVQYLLIDELRSGRPPRSSRPSTRRWPASRSTSRTASSSSSMRSRERSRRPERPRSRFFLQFPLRRPDTSFGLVRSGYVI